MNSKNKEIHTIEKVEKISDKERFIRITTAEREIVVKSDYENDSVKHLESIAQSLFNKSKENTDRSYIR